MRYDHFSMLPERAFLLQANRLATLEGGGKGGSAPAAPNYQPMAAASDHAADLSYDLGNKSLAQNQAQYDKNMAVAQPLIDQQSKLSQQAYDQGNQNYNRMVSQGQPIQDQMKNIAMGGDYTDGQKAQQETAAGTAMADARAGTNQQMQQLIRQGLRYGWSPDKLAAMGSSAALTGAQEQTNAANNARATTKQQQYGQMGDVYNTYAGLGSQAPSFYGASSNGANTANGMNLGNSQAYMGNMNTANGTIMQGQGLKVQGLGNILNSQTNAYGMGLQANAQSNMGLGSMLGTGLGAYAALSDRRLKENIVEVGEYPNGLKMYEFNYIGNDKRYRGVMAQDIEYEFPDAIHYDDCGFMSVDYALLGIEMTEV